MSSFTLGKSLDLFNDGKIQESKQTFGISNSLMSVDEFITHFTSIDTGLKLISKHRIIEAIPHLETGKKLIEISNDAEAKFVISILIEFGHGLKHLHSGDPYLAHQIFERVSAASKKMSVFDIYIKRFALSAEAASCIALSRIYMSSGNIDEVKRWQSEAEFVYEEYKEILNDDEPDDIPAFIEIYSYQIEIACFWIYMDLQVVDFENVNRVINSSQNNYLKLKTLIESQDIKNVDKISIALMNVYECFIEISQIYEDIVYKQKRINKIAILNLKSTTSKLYETKELLLKCGLRGQGLIWFVKQMESLTNNLMKINYSFKKDFGLHSGLITGLSFIIISLFMKIFLNVTDFTLAHFGCIFLLSLIIGFGIGAIKFVPLIKIYNDTLKNMGSLK